MASGCLWLVAGGALVAGLPVASQQPAVYRMCDFTRGNHTAPKNLGAAEEPRRLIIKRNLAGEEYRDTRDLTKEELESEKP